MNLMMFLGNDLIESIPLEVKRISKPGYVGSVKRSLKMKYSELIQQYEEKPEFLVIQPAPVTSKVKNISDTNPEH